MSPGRATSRSCACLALFVGVVLLSTARPVHADVSSRAGIVVGPEQKVEAVVALGVPVDIAGTVKNSVVVIGGHLSIAGSAHIREDVYVIGGTFDIDPRAQVSGAVTALSPALLDGVSPFTGTGAAVAAAMLVARLVFIAVLVAIAWALAPTELTARQAERFAIHPLRVIGLGFLWAALVGTTALVASLTVLGLPLALLLVILLGGESAVGLALGLAFLCGHAFTRTGRRIVLSGLGLLALIPPIGEIALYAAAGIGLGLTLAALAEVRGARRVAREAGL